jgi:OOP family OmpA-OmpF porin
MRTVAIMMVFVGLAAPAAAADRGFYVGGGLGVSPVDPGDFYPEYQDLRFDESTPGFKLFGGYRFMKNFGVEVDYLDLGQFTKREEATTKEDLKVEVGITAFTVVAVGILPVGNNVSFLGKLGAASWDVDAFASLDDDKQDLSRTGTDLTLGVGIEFGIKKSAIRVDIDWLDIPESGDEMMFSLNFMYNF